MTSNTHKLMTRLCVGILIGLSSLLGLPTGTAQDTAVKATEPLPRLDSGPRVGQPVHQFFVRAVTGPHRNRSVCYVCRYGDRPVMMVFIQELDPKLPQLLKLIDQVVDAGRAEGARSFGVLITDESQRVVPTLQTMAFDEKLELPLTAATTAVASATCHDLHPSAATTVVLYRRQKVIATHSFRRGELTDAALDKLATEMRRFVSPD